MTPRKPKRSEGEAPPTEEIGYGGGHLIGFDDPWEWLDSRRPDLRLRCKTSRQVVGVAWVAPDDEIWGRSPDHAPDGRPAPDTQQGKITGDEWPGPGERPDWWFTWDYRGNLMMTCPVHGRVLVPTAYVEDEARSTRREAPVLCCDPHPVYHRRS